MIRVRFAASRDVDSIVGFIRDHWSATHIFTERPEVFTWQYLQHDGRLNMVIAEQVAEDDASRVLGVLGFIPLGRFDPALDDTDVFLAIWKVRADGVPPGVGLRLLKYLQRELDPRLIAAIGTSEMVRPIYQVLRYEVGTLHQAAIFASDRDHDTMSVAVGVPAAAVAPVESLPTGQLELIPFGHTLDPVLRADLEVVAATGVPAKSVDYLTARYLDHPWYRYDVRAVRHHGRITAAVVWRRMTVRDACVMRIVDIVGDIEWLRDAKPVLRHEIEACGAEYIDVMQHGIDPELLAAGGFVSPADTPGLVLPNYFAPFERRNVEIELAYKVFGQRDRPVRLFRADSDQDRPNRSAELELGV